MGTTLTELLICSFSAVFKQIRYFASVLKLAAAVARRIVTCTCVRLLPPFFHCPLFASGHVMQGAGVPSIKDQLGAGHLRERSVVSLITPKVLKEARCQCVRLLIAPTILPLSTDCIRSRHARRRCAFDQRSVGHLRERSVVSLITPKVLKEARRCELVLRDSFPFRWSASEVQAKWPVSAHTHRHSCWTDSKSFENPQLVWTGMWNLQRRSNGERQTDRARIKAPWTH